MSNNFTVHIIDFDGRRKGTSESGPFDFYSCYVSCGEGDNIKKGSITSPVIDGKNPPITGYDYPVVIIGASNYSDKYGKHLRWRAAFDPDYVS